MGGVLVESFWSATLVLLSAPFSGREAHRDLRTRIAFAFAKTQNEKLSSRQLQQTAKEHRTLRGLGRGKPDPGSPFPPPPPAPFSPTAHAPFTLARRSANSPWGDFSTRAPSFSHNTANDSINGATLRKWAACFMGGARADNYNQPFLAADYWWRGLQEVVHELLVTAGTDEVLVDGIEGFAKTVEAAHPSTRTLFAPREFHDQPFMESDDEERRCQQGKVLRTWLVARM
ncbi:MAG: hypothetical protein Q9196_006045 [Gyalolechia fulgens]